MLKKFIRDHIDYFIIERSEFLTLEEMVEAIYDEYAHYDQIGYAVVHAVRLYRLQKELAETQEITCDSCEGMGINEFNYKCSQCHGSGTIKR